MLRLHISNSRMVGRTNPSYVADLIELIQCIEMIFPRYHRSLTRKCLIEFPESKKMLAVEGPVRSSHRMAYDLLQKRNTVRSGIVASFDQRDDYVGLVC